MRGSKWDRLHRLRWMFGWLDILGQVKRFCFGLIPRIIKLFSRIALSYFLVRNLWRMLTSWEKGSTSKKINKTYNLKRSRNEWNILRVWSRTSDRTGAIRTIRTTKTARITRIKRTSLWWDHLQWWSCKNLSSRCFEEVHLQVECHLIRLKF